MRQNALQNDSASSLIDFSRRPIMFVAMVGAGQIGTGKRARFIGRALGILRHRAFLFFWLGAFVSNTGNWTENAAQSWAVTTQTRGGSLQGMMVETLQFADFCPVLLLALFAGVIADRVNRKIWLIILQTTACLLGAGLAIAAYLGKATPWVVIAFTFMEGIVWALNGPTILAVTPTLVPRAELDRALALNSVQFNMARLCGPMISAALIGAVGITGAFTFNAFTFLPLLVALFFAVPAAQTPARKESGSIKHDLSEGLRFVWTHPGTRRLTIMSVIFMFLSAPLQGLLPVFAESVLHGGPTLFGMMLSAIGLGSIGGAFLLSLIPTYYPRHHLIPLAMFIFSAFGLAFSFSKTPAISLAILVACGTCWLLSLNPSNTANQLLATDENRGPFSRSCFWRNKAGCPGPSARRLSHTLYVSRVGFAIDARDLIGGNGPIRLDARARHRQHAAPRDSRRLLSRQPLGSCDRLFTPS